MRLHKEIRVAIPAGSITRCPTVGFTEDASVVATAPRQASQFGRVGVDTGHCPVVERRRLASTAAAVTARSPWAATISSTLRRNSSGWRLGTDTAPSTGDVVTKVKQADYIQPRAQQRAHKIGDGSASDIDSGNRGLEGARTMDPARAGAWRDGHGTRRNWVVT